MSYLIGTVVYVLIGSLLTFAVWRINGHVANKEKRIELVIDLTFLVLLWPLWIGAAWAVDIIGEISFSRLYHEMYKMYKRMWGEV